MMEILLCLLLIIKSGLITLADPSVSLTVGGGGSLVGEHCPGNISLFCEGVELHGLLRWRYNGNVTLQTFLSDNEPSITTPLNNPAFLSVQLTAISALSDSIVTFSSVLLVDAELLHRNAINSISCGDLSTFESLPIDLIIIYETPLSNPEISFISAFYDSGVLQNVQQPACPGHVLDSISYTVDLEGFQPTKVEYNNCGVEICEVNVSNRLELKENAYQLTLSVINTTYQINGSLSPYKTVRNLSNTSDDYLLIKHNFDHYCHTKGVHTSPLNASTVTFCSITYRNNIHQVLHELNVSIGEQFTLNDLAPDYYEAVIRIYHSDINEVHLKSNFIVGPSSPEIVKVILFFSGRAELRNIQVYWANNVTCNHDLIRYDLRVAVRTQVVSTKSISSDECMPTLCTLTTLVTSRHLTESLNLLLVAVNSGGTSVREYGTPVYQSSILYYQPGFQLLNCTTLQINCFEVAKNASCICEYFGNDYLYEQLQSKQDLRYNSVLKLHQGIPLHYFVLKWNVSETLELREEFFYNVIHFHLCEQEMERYFTTSITITVTATVHSVSRSTLTVTPTVYDLVTYSTVTVSTYIVPSKSANVPVLVPDFSRVLNTGPTPSNITNTSSILIIAASSGGASLVCLFCIIMLVAITCITKRNQKERNIVITSDNVPTERKNESQSSTPVYEEIPMFQFNDIKVNTNEAYGHFDREAEPEPVYREAESEPVYQNILR